MKKIRRLITYMLRGPDLPPPGPKDFFHADYYLRHNARRLEHLASLRIPVAGMKVLEVGAGIGDHSGYYLDRGCKMTITEARKENLEILRQRYPEETILLLDMEHPSAVPGAPFDVVHCYGLLYHLNNPTQGLGFLSAHCRSLLILETCVSFGSGLHENRIGEELRDFTQAISGAGCRPTRPWVFAELKRHFPFVYCSRTQPNHDEFPTDWNTPEKHKFALQRSVFVASRAPLDNQELVSHLPDVQPRQI